MTMSFQVNYHFDDSGELGEERLVCCFMHDRGSSFPRKVSDGNATKSGREKQTLTKLDHNGTGLDSIP